MNKPFADKYGPYALVTGATSGIGSEICNQIAEQGVNLVLVARRKNVLQEKAVALTEKYGIKVEIIPADLSTSEGSIKVMEETKNIEIGLFVPCAGLENHGLATDIDLTKELAVVQLNVTSVFELTHHFARQMATRKRGGVLLVSSLYGHMPAPYFANYGATKAYVLSFGSSLHWEMKKKGVDVTVLSPGMTSTPMSAQLGDTFDLSKIPLLPMSPEKTAKLGLNGLGRKAVVIPGFKNNVMAFMTKHFAGISQAITMGGKMMEKAMVVNRP